MNKEVRCPIFEATGKKAIKTECESCPFNDDCPEDAFSDVVAKVMKQIGDYMHGELKGE